MCCMLPYENNLSCDTNFSVKLAERLRHWSHCSITQKEIVSVVSSRSNMHEANWQWDRIAFFSLLLSPYHTQPRCTKMAKTNHNTAVQSDQAMWLQAENVFPCFLSDCGMIQEAMSAECLMHAQVTKPGCFKPGRQSLQKRYSSSSFYRYDFSGPVRIRWTPTSNISSCRWEGLKEMLEGQHVWKQHAVVSDCLFSITNI